jgi:phosphoribosylglycinamide formyltransferase 1
MDKINIKLAVFSSGKGTSIRPLINKIQNQEISGVEISLVFTNKLDAPIIEYAKNNNIRTYTLEYSKESHKNREGYDMEIDNLLNGIDYIFLVGYMRLISPWMINKWKNKIINLHPSLLPAFAGMMDLGVHQAVLDRGCKITGASIMFIDEGADTGQIINQKSIEVYNDDTAESLKSRIQAVESTLIIDFVKSIINIS